MDTEKLTNDNYDERKSEHTAEVLDASREKKDYYMRVMVVQLVLCLVFVASLTAMKKVNAASFETLKNEYDILMADDGNPVGKAVKGFFADTLAVKAAAMGDGDDYEEQVGGANAENGDDTETSGDSQSVQKLISQLEVQTALNSYGREISVVLDSELKAQDVGITEKAFRPIPGKKTSPFGSRKHPITGKDSFHAGIDLSGNEGDPIGAAFDGTVLKIGKDDSFGNYIIVKHEGGIKTLYAHCSSIKAKQGDVVSAGDTIALVGSTGQSTGNHLHFELRIGESNIRLNPEIIIDV